MTEGRTPTAEERRQILRARAKALAGESRAPAATPALAVVEFELAHERYAIESRYVREVFPLKELTPLPGAPAFIRGVIHFRGRMYAVLDLRKAFDLPDRGLTDLNKVLIVHGAGVDVGILADAIAGMRLVPLEDIQPTLPTLTGIRREFLRGVTADGLVVLDADAVAAADRGRRSGQDPRSAEETEGNP